MKVILATDGSQYSALALELITKLPTVRESEVIVCAVVTPVRSFAMGIEVFPAANIGQVIEEAHTAQREALQRYVNEAVATLQALGIQAQGVIRDGEVVHELLALAKDEAAQLLAIGSRGAGAVEAFLLGSIARELVNKSPISMLVARCHDHDSVEATVANLKQKSKLNIVLGFDGSDGSRCALKSVLDQGPNAFGVAAAACGYPYSAALLGYSPDQFALNYEAEHKEAQRLCAEAEKAMEPVTDRAIACVGIGGPLSVIEAAAKEVQADLIVVGATQHGFFERLILGSTSAEAVAKASCSVWVVRPA